MQIIYLILQVVLILLLAPFIEGIIKKYKAFWQNRRGPGLLQPYYNLIKYMQKDSVKSEHTSWIYDFTPIITFSSIAAAGLFIPTVSTVWIPGFAGDIIMVIYLFAMARFFMALAGLDTGSSFGGMGSSREMVISSLVEPVLMLAVFSVVIRVGSTNLAVVADNFTRNGFSIVSTSHLLAFAAVFVVAIAETGRIPVDNPDTHLELTMIHEGMLLEYAGKPLALMFWSAMVKQLLILSILVNVFMPWGIALSNSISGIIISLIVYLSKVIVLALIMATVETAYAKLRIFKVPELMGMAFTLALLAVIAQLLLRG